MRQMKSIFTFLLVGCSNIALAPMTRTARMVLVEQTGMVVFQQHAHHVAAGLDAQWEKRTLLTHLESVEAKITSAAEAMPADKYGFAPTDGEFKGVRTFGQQVKHLAAANHILAAAALGEGPPTDAGDETGPESVRTKAEILDYLSGSFAHLGKAIDAIINKNASVKSSLISPFKDSVSNSPCADSGGVDTCV